MKYCHHWRNITENDIQSNTIRKKRKFVAVTLKSYENNLNHRSQYLMVSNAIKKSNATKTFFSSKDLMKLSLKNEKNGLTYQIFVNLSLYFFFRQFSQKNFGDRNREVSNHRLGIPF